MALSPASLARMHLPDVLHKAVLAAQGMRQHGARKRQMQYIGKLMRQIDPAPIRAALEALAPVRAVAQRPEP